MQDLSARDAGVAREVAARLGKRGHRTWLVGGVVRDLVLGRTTHDVDVASSAKPEEVEAEFERTVPLGRAFGTVLIHLGGMDVEHTTFRSESGYSDGRRPDVVTFGKSPEEDATRRDFTCNALYLDPLDERLLDPTGGMSDLQQHVLRCVGDPSARFREDGLRIVRMARFAGQLGLEPTLETQDAAKGELDALRGVSAERVRVELERLLAKGGIVRAVRLLSATGALGVVLPGMGRDPAEVERGMALFEHLPDPPGEKLGLAALLRPTVGAHSAIGESVARLEGLKPSRVVRDHVVDAWRLEEELGAGEPPSRSTRVRWMRRDAFADALTLAKARALSFGKPDAAVRRLREIEEERVRRQGTGEVAAFLVSTDLVERGVGPGKAFGEILREAETLQLDGVLGSREAALQWLERRVREGKPRAE